MNTSYLQDVSYIEVMNREIRLTLESVVEKQPQEKWEDFEG